ncbi:hypothetical protein AB0H75_50160, partial [Nonomuraea sp. NPDC050783]
TRLLLPHALHHGHPSGDEPLISDVRQTGSSPPSRIKVVHLLPEVKHYHQQYLYKVPNGYCGIGGTGVACPVGLTAAEA